MTIAEHDGVRYIDDALASNPFAAAAAIGAVGDRPVTWLIGGQSRDVSLEPMLQALVAASKPVLFATGTEDAILEKSRTLAGFAPQGTFFEIPGRNHFNAPTSRAFREAAIAFLGVGTTR